MKATGTAVGHGVIVSLAGGTLHGRIIEEGNVSVAISSIVPGSEGVWLYEANNDNEPPMARLGDALNSMTKWPLEAVKAAWIAHRKILAISFFMYWGVEAANAR